MELHHRIEMINTLLEDADQRMQSLHHALAAKDLTHEVAQHQEDVTLKYEQDLWEKACKGLQDIRAVLEDIEESERQRGLSQ